MVLICMMVLKFIMRRVLQSTEAGCWLNLEFTNELVKDIYNNYGKEQAIDAVENAAMAGHKLPAVLDVCLALDERLCQITERRSYCD